MNSLRLVTVRDWQDEVEPRKRPRSQIGSGVFLFSSEVGADMMNLPRRVL